MLSRLASRLRTAAIGSALGLTAGLGAYAYVKVRRPHSRKRLARYPILIKSPLLPGATAHQWMICHAESPLVPRPLGGTVQSHPAV